MSAHTIIIPDEATVLEAAQQAEAGHLHILCRNGRTVLSPVMLKGWDRLIVKIKTPTRAELVAAGGPAT